MSLLSIEQWRQEIGYHPWHFWGLGGSLAKMRSNCNSIVKKYAWQAADAMGRDDIERSIADTESRIVPHLDFFPAPKWVEETYDFPRYPQPNIVRMGYTGSDARWLTIKVNQGKVISSGYQRTTLISTESVVYTDDDGDGLNENFTVTCATTVTDATQIKLFFQASDRLEGDGLIEKWEIKPVRVSISGGIATIRGKGWMMVKPILYEGISPEDYIEASESTNYVSKVDVVRQYIDPDGTSVTDAQATLIWETSPFPYWSDYPPGTYDPASIGMAIARVGIRNAEQGIVSIGESAYVPATGKWYGIPWYDSASRFKPPDRVIIRYLSGVPLVDGKMATDMASIVYKVAAADAPRRICACDESNRALQHWQFDLARTGGVNGEAYGAISSQDLNTPLGTRRGQVMGWKEIRVRRQFNGFTP